MSALCRRLPPRPRAAVSEERAYYRPVRIVGNLLVLQSLGLAGLVAYQVSETSRDGLAASIGWSQALDVLLSGGAEGGAAPAAVLFAPPAVLVLVAGLWFLFRRRGWVLASVAQGICLGVCLLLYSGSAPVFIYPVMAYCVLAIMYLNSRDVRTIMHAPRRFWTTGG